MLKLVSAKASALVIRIGSLEYTLGYTTTPTMLKLVSTKESLTGVVMDSAVVVVIVSVESFNASAVGVVIASLIANYLKVVFYLLEQSL